MLDVHPPHHPTHTWKDFFVHIATICVGLLIAIGLEQTVETIHRAREAHELRESLGHETEKIVRDSADADQGLTVAYDWETKLIRQTSDAGLRNQPLGEFPTSTRRTYLIADDPVYRAARANGQLALLSREEVQAYSEVDTLIAESQLTRQEVVRENKLLNDFMDAEQFAQPAGTGLLAHASREELRQFYNLLTSAHTEHALYRDRLRHVWAAEVAISHGERDLDKIEAAEFNKTP